jgi:hypothetical protein
VLVGVLSRSVNNSVSTVDSNTIISNQSNRKTSDLIFRGNISFTSHFAAGYIYPISFIIPTGTGFVRTTVPLILSTLKESAGNTRSDSLGTRLSQSVILVVTSLFAVLVVTETNSARTIVVGLPITTTITSPPLAYTTSLVSNTLWHLDTTTTSGATIFLVLYSCSALCGGDDYGLIIKGLRGDPTDPIRTGCGKGLIRSIFRSFFSCGTEFNFPLLIFAIGVDSTLEIV